MICTAFPHISSLLIFPVLCLLVFPSGVFFNRWVGGVLVKMTCPPSYLKCSTHSPQYTHHEGRSQELTVLWASHFFKLLASCLGEHKQLCLCDLCFWTYRTKLNSTPALGHCISKQEEEEMCQEYHCYGNPPSLSLMDSWANWAAWGKSDVGWKRNISGERDWYHLSKRRCGRRRKGGTERTGPNSSKRSQQLETKDLKARKP